MTRVEKGEEESEWSMEIFFFKHKTAYEIYLGGWSSDVCLPIWHGQRQKTGFCEHVPQLRVAAPSAPPIKNQPLNAGIVPQLFSTIIQLASESRADSGQNSLKDTSCGETCTGNYVR